MVSQSAIDHLPKGSAVIAQRNSDLSNQKRSEILRTCQEFESVLVNQMFETMRKTIPEGGLFEKSNAESIFTSMLDTELARSASTRERSGLGLASQMYEQLARESIDNVPLDYNDDQLDQQLGLGNFGATQQRYAPSAPGQSDMMLTPDSVDMRQIEQRYGASPGRMFEHPLPSGEISSPYGMREHPMSGERRMHRGVDIAAPMGTPVKAARAGEVIFAGENGGYGNMVILRHPGGYESRYAHASALTVQQGDRVDAGEVVALVGSSGRSTGPHLHFEIRRNEQDQNPMILAGIAD